MFEPLVLANIALGVMFVGRPIADLLTQNTVHIGLDISTMFDLALVATLVAIVAFEVGYFSPFSLCFRRIVRMGTAVNAARTLSATVGLVVIALTLFTIFLAKNGGIGTLVAMSAGRRTQDDAIFCANTAYLYNGINALFPASVILYGMSVLRRSTTLKVCAWLIAAVPTAFYLMRGDRSVLISLLAIPIFRALYEGKRPRGRSMLLVGITAVCLMGAIRQFRNVEGRENFGSESKNSLFNPVGAALDILNGNDAEMFDGIANEMTIVPRLFPFHPGGVLLAIPVRMLPRVWFPNKPMELNDALYATLWPDHYAKTRAGFALSVVGPFYADTGFVKVFVGMFGIGVIFRGMWRWYLGNSDSLWAAAAYGISLPYVVHLMRGTVTDALAGTFFTVMPLFVVARIGRKQSWAATRAHAGVGR